MPLDPIALTAELVRCPTVTPDASGALDVCERALASLGFTCTRLPFSAPGTPDVDNLFAKLGSGAPHLTFNGHVDVVPPGETAAWRHPPFAAEIAEGRLYGRGAVDMKSGVACWIAAIAAYLERHGPPPGTLSVMITGDEEGPAINGTKKILEWATARGERFDACLVGEPTSPTVLGELAKIGRRGSLTGRLLVRGRQGHTAYPQRADNAAHRMVAYLHALVHHRLDTGTEWFQPSNLQVSTIDIGNPTSNVIPGIARAVFNVRFNDLHTGASLERRLRTVLDAVGGAYELEVSVSGEAFRTDPGTLSETLAAAIEAETGRRPTFDTTGGTSDARFVAAYAPVIEFGLVGTTMHQVDEHVVLADIASLTRIYTGFIERFFAA